MYVAFRVATSGILISKHYLGEYNAVRMAAAGIPRQKTLPREYDAFRVVAACILRQKNVAKGIRRTPRGGGGDPEIKT
jgi:hypothetical protein